VATTRNVTGIVPADMLPATVVATPPAASKVNSWPAPVAAATPDANGNFTLALYALADMSPNGQYDVQIKAGNGGVIKLGDVAVPATAGPFLLAKLVQSPTTAARASAGPVLLHGFQTTAPGAGGAAALPAAPAGYVQVTIGGVDRFIPVY
jgi:hypothetical protein